MLDDLIQRLRSGKTTALELVEEALHKADAPAAAHVFTRRYDEAAIAAARAPQGPFAGVPITIKDNVAVAGEVTWAGSKVLAGAAAAKDDAPIVRRLTRAGFIILGRTNMTEFAFSGIGINPHYGTPHNPAFSDARIPGGSSSGAGVCVGLNITPVAIGSDTGGSVRIPAALCGVTGFKPTADAITTAGVYPLSGTLDSVGVLAHSVADCAAVFDVIRERAGAREPRSLKGARLGVLTNYVRDGIEDEVARAFDGAAKRLAAAGAEIVPLTLPELDELPDFNRKGTLVMAEAFTHLRDVVTGREDDCDPRIITRILAGGSITPSDRAAMLQRLAGLRASAAARLKAFDGYLMPTVPFIAPTIASLETAERYHDANRLVLRNPSVVNLLGGCAISLPCHAKGAPPVGLSLAMNPGDDDKLLSLAAAAEAAFG